MAKRYRHLTASDRDRLAMMRWSGWSLRRIARKMGRDPSTISRELKRNAPPIQRGLYLPYKAQARAELRWGKAVNRERIRDRWARSYISRRLQSGWTPELISGRMKILRPRQAYSHEAIYQWVYSQASHLIPCLPRRHRNRRRRGYGRRSRKYHIPNRIHVGERPAAANERRQSGHWEADTIVSSRSSPVLQLAVERRARYTILNRLRGRHSAAMRAALNRSMRHLPVRHLRSITYDNGSENVEHGKVNDTLGTKSFFCTPYTSQERGTVENTAGLVRRFFPKGTNFARVSSKKVKAVQYWLNHRPRKVLNYKTPAEVFR